MALRKKKQKLTLSQKLSAARKKRPGSSEDDFQLNKRGNPIFMPDRITNASRPKRGSQGLAAQRKRKRIKKIAKPKKASSAIAEASHRGAFNVSLDTKKKRRDALKFSGALKKKKTKNKVRKRKKKKK